MNRFEHEIILDVLTAALEGANGSANALRDLIRPHGPTAVPFLLEVLPRLGFVAKRDAVEILEAIGDPSCVPALIALLDDDHHVVRAWAAWAIGVFRAREAVPALRNRYEELERDRPEHREWTEGVVLRRVLSELDT